MSADFGKKPDSIPSVSEGLKREELAIYRLHEHGKKLSNDVDAGVSKSSLRKLEILKAVGRNGSATSETKRYCAISYVLS